MASLRIKGYGGHIILDSEDWISNVDNSGLAERLEFEAGQLFTYLAGYLPVRTWTKLRLLMQEGQQNAHPQS